MDFGGLRELQSRGSLWTTFHHKRWFYTFVASRDYFIAAAIVHLGYAGTAFLSIVDRQARAMLYDHAGFTLPYLVRVGKRAEEGCDAQFRGPRLRMAFTRPLGSSRYVLSASTRRVSLRIKLESAASPEPIVSVSPIPGGAVNVTEKRVSMPSHGTISVDGSSRDFEGACGGLDYTSGMLARNTRWRWAFGMGTAEDGRRIAFNLVDGFNGGRECAIWLDETLIPTQGARFELDAGRPLAPWQVTTPDGCLSLEFRGDAMHEERLNLGIIRSGFKQPMGHFSGRIILPGRPETRFANIPGVVESQAVTW